MSKTITLHLTEEEFRNLHLCFHLGDLVKDHLEEKTREEMLFQISLFQKLDKAAYEAKLKGSGVHEDFYYYGKDLEEQMLEILEEFKEYIRSGEDEADDEAIRKQLEQINLLNKKKKK